MKRLLGGTLLALLLLAALLVGRALSVGPDSTRVHPAPALELDQRAVSERLARALAIPFVASAEPDAVESARREAMLDFIVEEFGRVVRATEVERREHGLVLRWRGSEPELAPLLLLAHLDVVPVEPGTEGEWTRPPFAGGVAAGAIWGRGALDDKGPALAILEAINHLSGQGVTPRRSVVVALGMDEEIGGERGAASMAADFAREGLAPWMTLDEGLAVLEGIVPGVEAPVAAVGVAEKGYATLRLSVEAGGGHASMPPDQTAVGILSAAVARLEAAPFPARFDGPARRFLEALAGDMPFPQRLAVTNAWLCAPLITEELLGSPETAALLRTTQAVTTARGGVAENVLPERASATLNLRLHPRDSVASALERVRAVVGDERVEVEVLAGAHEPSASSPAEGEAWRHLERTLRACFEGVRVAPSLVLGATDARHYVELSPYVYRFAPLRLERDDLARIHGTDERLRVRDYVAMIRFYCELLRGA